jgi:OOP family OmpA-OmpF porin
MTFEAFRSHARPTPQAGLIYKPSKGFTMIKLRPLTFSLLVAVASMAATTGALAQGSGPYGGGSGYVGLNAGQTNFQMGNGTGIFGADSRNTAYGLYAGSYFRDSNLGMELGYTDFGRVNRAGGTTKADGINLSLIGRLPLATSFSLLGKVGGIYARTDVSTGAGSGVTAGSTSDLDWTWGIGVAYAFASQWSGVIQYDSNAMKFAGGDREWITNLAAGVRYVY